MKKTLSIVLAVMMLFALMIPAFAEDATAGNPDNPAGGESIILTSDKKTDGTDGRTWKVTYPAQTEIAWGTPSTEIKYTAEAHLAYNEKLTVNVAASEASKMVHEADAQYFLVYTLANAEDTVIGPVAAAEKKFNVNIADDQWNAAPVGAYRDTLTFTATVA